MKANLLLLTFLLAYACVSDTFESKVVSSCCSTVCNESKIINNKYTPNKVKSYIGNMINNNLTSGNFTAYLKTLNINFTSAFLDRMIDFDWRVNNGLASCPTDVTNTGQVPTSAVTEGTVRLLLQSIQDTFLQNAFNESAYFIEAKSYFTNELGVVYDELWGFIYGYEDDGSPIFDPIPAKYVGYGACSAFMEMLGPYQQASVKTTYQKYVAACNQALAGTNTSAGCPIIVSQGDLFNSINQLFPSQLLNVSSSLQNSVYYYSKNSPNTWQSNQNNFKMYAASSTFTTTVFNTSVLNYVQGDMSLYDPVNINNLMQVDYAGTLDNAPGVDLSAYPNGGFGPGESATSVWAKILAMNLGPLLYCRYSDLLSKLLNSCPATCNSSC